MKNELLDKDIILPSGESGRDKINLVAGGNHAAIDRLSFGSLGQRLSTTFWQMLAIASKDRYNIEKTRRRYYGKYIRCLCKNRYQSQG